MNYEELMNEAVEASKNSYSPYSKFRVGACVLTETGKTFRGCNFENSSFGLTICAERNAVGSAVADGEKFIKAVAIYSPNQERCFPCGACRQVLHEFARSDDELDVILKNNNGIEIHKLSELLPESFTL